jgi:hypothetical protein
LELDEIFRHGIAFDALLLSGLLLFIWLNYRIQRALQKRRCLTPGGESALLNRVTELARPTLLLVPATSPSFSKLGGAPNLPTSVRWPEGEKGPLTFVAQIDLAAAQSSVVTDWLPADGRLYVFCDPDDWGEQVQIVFSRDQPGAARPSVSAAYRERGVAFASYVSLPTPEWLNLGGRLDIDFEELEAPLRVIGERPPEKAPRHRIAGYPDEIQGGCLRMECEHLARGLPTYVPGVPPASEVEHASWAWRLLLQIDSDPALGMEFGDGGRLYVFVREPDAQAADFSKIVTLSQCY